MPGRPISANKQLVYKPALPQDSVVAKRVKPNNKNYIVSDEQTITDLAGYPVFIVTQKKFDALSKSRNFENAVYIIDDKSKNILAFYQIRDNVQYKLTLKSSYEFHDGKLVPDRILNKVFERYKRFLDETETRQIKAIIRFKNDLPIGLDYSNDIKKLCAEIIQLLNNGYRYRIMSQNEFDAIEDKEDGFYKINNGKDTKYVQVTNNVHKELTLTSNPGEIYKLENLENNKIYEYDMLSKLFVGCTLNCNECEATHSLIEEMNQLQLNKAENNRENSIVVYTLALLYIFYLEKNQSNKNKNIFSYFFEINSNNRFAENFTEWIGKKININSTEYSRIIGTISAILQKAEFNVFDSFSIVYDKKLLVGGQLDYNLEKSIIKKLLNLLKKVVEILLNLNKSNSAQSKPLHQYTIILENNSLVDQSSQGFGEKSKPRVLLRGGAEEPQPQDPPNALPKSNDADDQNGDISQITVGVSEDTDFQSLNFHENSQLQQTDKVPLAIQQQEDVTTSQLPIPDDLKELAQKLNLDNFFSEDVNENRKRKSSEFSSSFNQVATTKEENELGIIKLYQPPLKKRDTPLRDILLEKVNDLLELFQNNNQKLVNSLSDSQRLKSQRFTTRNQNKMLSQLISLKENIYNSPNILIQDLANFIFYQSEIEKYQFNINTELTTDQALECLACGFSIKLKDEKIYFAGKIDQEDVNSDLELIKKLLFSDDGEPLMNEGSLTDCLDKSEKLSELKKIITETQIDMLMDDSITSILDKTQKHKLKNSISKLINDQYENQENLFITKLARLAQNSDAKSQILSKYPSDSQTDSKILPDEFDFQISIERSQPVIKDSTILDNMEILNEVEISNLKNRDIIHSQAEKGDELTTVIYDSQSMPDTKIITKNINGGKHKNILISKYYRKNENIKTIFKLICKSFQALKDQENEQALDNYLNYEYSKSEAKKYFSLQYPMTKIKEMLALSEEEYEVEKEIIKNFLSNNSNNPQFKKLLNKINDPLELVSFFTNDNCEILHQYITKIKFANGYKVKLCLSPNQIIPAKNEVILDNEGNLNYLEDNDEQKLKKISLENLGLKDIKSKYFSSDNIDHNCMKEIEETVKNALDNQENNVEEKRLYEALNLTLEEKKAIAINLSKELYTVTFPQLLSKRVGNGDLHTKNMKILFTKENNNLAIKILVFDWGHMKIGVGADKLMTNFIFKGGEFWKRLQQRFERNEETRVRRMPSADIFSIVARGYEIPYKVFDGSLLPTFRKKLNLLTDSLDKAVKNGYNPNLMLIKDAEIDKIRELTLNSNINNRFNNSCSILILHNSDNNPIGALQKDKAGKVSFLELKKDGFSKLKNGHLEYIKTQISRKTWSPSQKTCSELFEGYIEESDQEIKDLCNQIHELHVKTIKAIVADPNLKNPICKRDKEAISETNETNESFNSQPAKWYTWAGDRLSTFISNNWGENDINDNRKNKISKFDRLLNESLSKNSKPKESKDNFNPVPPSRSYSLSKIEKGKKSPKKSPQGNKQRLAIQNNTFNSPLKKDEINDSAEDSNITTHNNISATPSDNSSSENTFSAKPEYEIFADSELPNNSATENINSVYFENNLSNSGSPGNSEASLSNLKVSKSNDPKTNSRGNTATARRRLDFGKKTGETNETNQTTGQD